jgi:trigger factor
LVAVLEGCRRSLEVSVPAPEVDAEVAKAVADVQKRARIPGFRPGKVPASLVRQQFRGEVRQKVVENLIPKALQAQMEAEDLHPVGRPDVTDIHFEEGEPLRFKAEFEVIPPIELGEYKGVEVHYHQPEVSDEDMEKRINELREQRAEYVNLDPRPLENGDHAVVALESIAGLEGEPMKQDEMVIEIGGADTFEAFTENLRGLSPGDEKDIDIAYPADYASERLAGKTVSFHATVKGLRRKELPDLDDDFAKEIGDYRDLAELRDAVKKALLAQREHDAQQEAKNAIVEKLVNMHEFPVPEYFVDRQIENHVAGSLRAMGIDKLDPAKLNLDWQKIRESQKEKATREVKASLLLGRIAERETIGVTRDEVNREVEREARRRREPLAAVQRKFEKDGTMDRIANHIQTEKTLNFLFEHARKVA